jgi:hypothetical protein
LVALWHKLIRGQFFAARLMLMLFEENILRDTGAASLNTCVCCWNFRCIDMFVASLKYSVGWINQYLFAQQRRLASWKSHDGMRRQGCKECKGPGRPRFLLGRGPSPEVVDYQQLVSSHPASASTGQDSGEFPRNFFGFPANRRDRYYDDCCYDCYFQNRGSRFCRPVCGSTISLVVRACGPPDSSLITTI